MSTVEEELVGLRPTDPAGAVPDWPAHREAIRADLRRRTGNHRTDRTGSRWTSWRPRLMLAGAFAIVVVAVVAVVVGTLVVSGRLPVAVTGITGVPASAPVRITGTGFLQQRSGEPTRLCVGAVGESFPVTCFTTVPVEGVDWDRVPGAQTHAGVREATATITGLWRDGVLHVETIAAPAAPPASAAELPMLCAAPTGQRLGTLDDGIDPSVEQAPGYQATWISQPTSGPYAGQTIVNLAVTGDRDAAEKLVRRSFAGLLCVGTIPGPTARELAAAQERVSTQLARLPVLATSYGPRTDGRNTLEVQVFLATDQVTDRVRAVVGDTLWTWTTVTGQFRVVP